VTHRPGRFAPAAVEYDDAWRSPARRLARMGAVIGDGVLAALIVIVATMAWAPLLGVSVARETLAARRETRVRFAEIARTQSAVWARQARRNAAERRHQIQRTPEP
jgi:hypothetical protein